MTVRLQKANSQLLSSVVKSAAMRRRTPLTVSVVQGRLSHDAPAPLTPPEAAFPRGSYVPLDVDALCRSKAWLVAKRKPAHGYYIINLLVSAWAQRPVASLANDPLALAAAADCDPTHWVSIAPEVMRGWVLCSDNRWYQPTLAQRACECWAALVRALRRAERVRELESVEWHLLRLQVFERDDYTCIYCGRRGGPLECDHLQPWSKGGLSVLNNLGTACRTCNQRKGAKTEAEFRQGLAANV